MANDDYPNYIPRSQQFGAMGSPGYFTMPTLPAFNLGRGGHGVSGGGESNVARGYAFPPGETMSPLERAQHLPPGMGGITYLPEAEVAREIAGLRGKQNTTYGEPPAPPPPQDPELVRLANQLGGSTKALTPFDTGISGQTVAKGVGKNGIPMYVGYGGQSGGAAAAGGGAGGAGALQAQLAAMQQRLAYHRSRGDTISAAGAQNQMAKLQEQITALGTLGVHQGQLSDAQRRTHLAEQIATPDIMGKTASLHALFQGNPEMAASFARALGGGSAFDLTKVQDALGGTNVVRTGDIYRAGGVGTQLGVPGVQALPPVQPFRLREEEYLKK